MVYSFCLTLLLVPFLHGHTLFCSFSCHFCISEWHGVTLRPRHNAEWVSLFLDLCFPSRHTWFISFLLSSLWQYYSGGAKVWDIRTNSQVEPTPKHTSTHTAKLSCPICVCAAVALQGVSVSSGTGCRAGCDCLCKGNMSFVLLPALPAPKPMILPPRVQVQPLFLCKLTQHLSPHTCTHIHTEIKQERLII